MAIGTWKRTLVVAALVSVVSGCSGAPDEGDVRTAVETNLSQTNEDIAQMAGGAAADRTPSLEMKDFELLGCDESGKDSYNCDVKMSLDTPWISMKDKTTTVRVRRTDEGWVVMKGVQ